MGIDQPWPWHYALDLSQSFQPFRLHLGEVELVARNAKLLDPDQPSPAIISQGHYPVVSLGFPESFEHNDTAKDLTNDSRRITVETGS